MGSGKKIGIGIIIIAIGIAYGVLGTGTDSAPAENAESPTVVEETTGLSGEVTIGLILPLTGDLATHGIENHEGSKYGVVEFNKYLEEIEAPWHLKMVSEDSATSPVIALEKLSALNAKGIGVVVGPNHLTSSKISCSAADCVNCKISANPKNKTATLSAPYSSTYPLYNYLSSIHCKNIICIL